MSLESRHGWHDLYLSLGSWPERIAECVSRGDRERDELDFYLAFFVQCHSLRDWAVASAVVDKEVIDLAIRSHDEMLLCYDISNRYKHLTLDRSSKFDPDWSIWIDHERSDRAWAITARGQTWLLWDLMISCLSFWEAAQAALNLDGEPKVYRPA